MKFLGKFIIGGFIHDTHKGRIGMILANSTQFKMHIRWFNGSTQIVDLNPIELVNKKILNRIKKYKAIQIEDFTLQVGLPTRVLKVINSPEYIDVNLESIAVPNHTLDTAMLLTEIFKLCNIHSVIHTDVKSRPSGNTYKTLVRCWI